MPLSPLSDFIAAPMDAEAALQRRSASYFQMNHVFFGPGRIGFSISWAREMPSDFFQLGASQSLSTRALWHSRGQYMLGFRQGKSRGKRAIGTQQLSQHRQRNSRIFWLASGL